MDGSLVLFTILVVFAVFGFAIICAIVVDACHGKRLAKARAKLLLDDCKVLVSCLTTLAKRFGLVDEEEPETDEKEQN